MSQETTVADREALLAISDERDAWLRRLLDAERAAYEAGYADGYRDGYEHGARVLEADWPTVIRPLERPTLTELELLRWGPGGREHAGDPRPCDFPGREHAA